LYEECLSITKELGYTNLYIHSLIKLAEVLHAKNNYVKAKELLTESIKLCDKNSDKFKLILCFKGFGDYYFALNEYERSAKIFGILDNFNEEIGLSKKIDKDNQLKEKLEQMQKEIGEENFNHNYKSGQKLDQKDAIEFILRETH